MWRASFCSGLSSRKKRLAWLSTPDVAVLGIEWLAIWKNPVVRQAERIWAATAFLESVVPSKEGARSINGTVGSCDSGMLEGDLVRAPARRFLRWICAARTSSRTVGRLSGGGTAEDNDGTGIGRGESVEVAICGFAMMFSVELFTTVTLCLEDSLSGKEVDGLRHFADFGHVPGSTT